MKRFYRMVFFTFITMCCLSCAMGADAPAPEKKDTEALLEAEFRWLRAEAEAEIVTVATKNRMSVQDAPSIVSVITGEEIRNMGAKNLADVMQTVPGFDLTEHNKAFSRITIRGTLSRVSLKGGNFGTVKPSAEFSYTGDDVRAYLYADYYRTDGYEAELGRDAAAVNPNYTAIRWSMKLCRNFATGR